MAILQTPPLDERIKNIRADIDAFIDAKVAEQAEKSPGVPAHVLRNLLTARGGGCECRSYLQLGNNAEVDDGDDKPNPVGNGDGHSQSFRPRPIDLY